MNNGQWIAWLAGIVEGEGYPHVILGSLNRGGGYFRKKRPRTVGLDVTQKGRWLTDTIMQRFGGHVYEVWHSRWQTTYMRWILRGKKAAALLRQLYPYLSPRRQAQIREVFRTCGLSIGP